MKKLRSSLGCAVLVAVLGLAACGGSDTTPSASPAAALSEAAASPSASPSGVPLPAPTVAGTIAFSIVQPPTDGRFPDNADIFIVRADGTHLEQLTDGPEWEEHPSWSPDGTRIVYDVGSNSFPREDPSIWVMNADGSGKARLTRGYQPHWSPDGERIVFTRYLGPPKYDVIFVMDADGSDVRLVTQRQLGQLNPSWTSDGKRVLFTNGFDDGYAVNPDGSGRVMLAQTKGKLLSDIAASPDGRSYAYPSAEDAAVYVARLSGEGAPLKVLEGLEDYLPEWAFATVSWTPDGKALSVANNTGLGTKGARMLFVNADGSGLSAVPGIANAIDPAWRPE